MTRSSSSEIIGRSHSRRTHSTWAIRAISTCAIQTAVIRSIVQILIHLGGTKTTAASTSINEKSLLHSNAIGAGRL